MQNRWETSLATGTVELIVNADTLQLTETFNGASFGAQCKTADYLEQKSLEAQNVQSRILKKLGAEVVAEVEVAVRKLLNP